MGCSIRRIAGCSRIQAQIVEYVLIPYAQLQAHESHRNSTKSKSTSLRWLLVNTCGHSSNAISTTQHSTADTFVFDSFNVFWVQVQILSKDRHYIYLMRGNGTLLDRCHVAPHRLSDFHQRSLANHQFRLPYCIVGLLELLDCQQSSNVAMLQCWPTDNNLPIVGLLAMLQCCNVAMLQCQPTDNNPGELLSVG